MKVKKYLVNDMKEALYQIKNDLGPEAMIINSRRVRRKGLWGLFVKRKLEVTAAVDEPVGIENRQELSQAVGAGLVASSAPAERLLRGDFTSRTRAQLAYNTAGAVEKPGDSSFPTRSSLNSALNNPVNSSVSSLPLRNNNNPTVSENKLHHELAEVKLLLHRIMRDKDVSHEDAFVSKWRQILLDIDMEEGLVERILEDVNNRQDIGRNDRDELIKVNITNKITRLLEPAYNDISYGKVYAFIGPTGVGKTTTLAKLAAQFTLFHQKQIALITIDTYRIGAVEQLKTYGEIIGVPLDVVMTPEELHRTVMRHKDKDLILIDTAGHPSHKVAQVKELMEFLEVINLPLDVFLVLSATTKNKDMFKCIEEFGRIDINKFIFTKIDETDSLGSMLNVIYRTNIPIYYVTDGQSVPDDIEQVYPKKLAKLLLKGVSNQNDGSSL